MAQRVCAANPCFVRIEIYSRSVWALCRIRRKTPFPVNIILLLLRPTKRGLFWTCAVGVHCFKNNLTLRGSHCCINLSFYGAEERLRRSCFARRLSPGPGCVESTAVFPAMDARQTAVFPSTPPHFGTSIWRMYRKGLTQERQSKILWGSMRVEFLPLTSSRFFRHLWCNWQTER